jgi:hypothetical protein
MRICPQPKGRAADPKIASMAWYRPRFDDGARDAVAYMVEPFERGSATRRKFREKRRHEPLSALRKAGISVAKPESNLILP